MSSPEITPKRCRSPGLYAENNSGTKPSSEGVWSEYVRRRNKVPPAQHITSQCDKNSFTFLSVVIPKI